MNSANPHPRVSIGLPVYNGERYLREALDSLLGQSFHDFEIIVSDNCSTDNTAGIVAERQQHDSRIRLVRQSRNLGAIGNFNAVFHEANGEYFKWAAHDDVCHPTFLQSCVDVLDRHRDVVWCHCESDQIDQDGKSWLERLDPDKSDSIELVDGRRRWVGLPRKDHASSSPSQRFAGVLLGGTWAADSYGLVRADELRATRMLLPCYGAEKVLIGELALRGRYFHIPDQLFAQRIHDEASGNIRSSRFQASFAVGDQQKRAFAPTRLALLLGHLGAIRGATISGAERARCLLVVARYLLQFHKWRKVIVGSMTGRGVGGEGVRQLRKDAGVVANRTKERVGERGRHV